MGSKFVGSEDHVAFADATHSGAVVAYSDWIDVDQACEWVEIAYDGTLNSTGDQLYLWLEPHFDPSSPQDVKTPDNEITGVTEAAGSFRVQLSAIPGSRRVRIGKRMTPGDSVSGLNVTIRETRSGR